MTMWLSSTNREVESFHPVCETILNNALAALGVAHIYRVEHHRMVGALEMDFVISNIATHKILCVIEVKRTIEAVMSTRYQLQAMGYVQQLRPAEKEANYFILTNLEAIGLFHYSPDRPTAVDQLLKPGIHTVMRFSDADREAFVSRLTGCFAELIRRMLNREVEYFRSFSNIVQQLSIDDHIIEDEQLWHSKFAALSYEYIRGALDKVGRTQLTDIRRLRSGIRHICEEALRVNFKGIFGLAEDAYQPLPPISSDIYSELYELGNNFLDADAVSDILFETIAQASPYPGAVPTDVELAKALFVLVRHFAGELSAADRILDPAAGSGNLLSVAPYFYPDIRPQQIVANDINEYLLQILSLRLGLKFPTLISRHDSPQIHDYDIADIPPELFEDVKVLVLNPPYLSHTSTARYDYKVRIIRRIEDLTGRQAITDSAKTPLEAPFIELICDMLPQGAVFACIIPLSHLLGKGESGVLFRQMLLSKFGLECIFFYPQQKIFKSVAQNTCVIVGRKGSAAGDVSVISCADTLDDVDYDALAKVVAEAGEYRFNGVEKLVLPRAHFEHTVGAGWGLNSVKLEAKVFIEDFIFSDCRFCYLEDTGLDNHRGRVGNSGGNDLIFINSNKEFYREVKHLVDGHTSFGVRTITSLEEPYLSATEALFLNADEMDPASLWEVISIYKRGFERKEGKQSRKTKPEEAYLDLIRRESRFQEPAGSVYLARDVRRNGKAYLTTVPLFPTTNVWVFPFSDRRKGQFYHSWFCSVFYQLDCELVAKNHAGARKMDMAEFNLSVVPVYEMFSDEDMDRICSLPVDRFIELTDPQIRPCDIVWAKIISPDAWSDLLEEARRYLSILANERES